MTDLRVTVASIVDDGAVRTLSLAGRDLPPYVPGSHLVVDCGGKANAYSLLDDGALPSAYRISVLRTEGGSGSHWMHRLRVGDELTVAPPRSAFAPAAGARHHLFIAAGIGITPLLSHAHAAVRWDRSFTLLYRHSTGAHLDELEALCGDRLVSLATRAELAALLPNVLVSQPVGTHLYVCGPGPLTAAVLDAARAAGWPGARLHDERFSAGVLDPGAPFAVRVGDSSFDVPAGTSLLEALESRGFSVPFRCRQGVCGECRIAVKAGRPQHRDLYLSDAERAAGDCLMPCVSRALDEMLEVAW